MYLTKARLEKVEIAKKSHPPQLVVLTAGDSKYLGIVYPNPESIPEELASNESIHTYQLTEYESLQGGDRLIPEYNSTTLVLAEEIDPYIDYTIYSISREIFKIELERSMTNKLYKFLTASNSRYAKLIETAIGKFTANVNISSGI